jgi:hypothetical protein
VLIVVFMLSDSNKQHKKIIMSNTLLTPKDNGKERKVQDENTIEVGQILCEVFSLNKPSLPMVHLLLQQIQTK